jgi:hypothetical protein
VTKEGIRRGVSLSIFRIGRLIFRSKPKKITFNIHNKKLFLKFRKLSKHIQEVGTDFRHSSVADPGYLSRIPDPDFYPSRIPDLGSRIPDPGSKNSNKREG